MSLEVAIAHRRQAFALTANLSAGAAEITALFGPSGAGKTTLIQVIAGLLRPQSGHVRLAGEVLTDTARGVHLPARRRGIGYVFQDGRLFPHLRVADNLLFGQRRARGRQTLDRASVIDLLGLGGLLDRRPRDLSGGERQRVALGRALLAGPRLLLLDEPLAALDQARKAEILPFLLRVRDQTGLPMLYVSHSIDEVTRLADRMVVLDRGAVRASGSVAELMGRLDLFPVTGRFEAGGVLEATVLTHDRADALTALAFAGGTLWVPLIDAAPGTRMRARIRARDVILAREDLRHTSANNVLPARVAAIRSDPGSYVDVQLDLAGQSLLARITSRSLRRLELEEGAAVFALIKSVSVDSRTAR